MRYMRCECGKSEAWTTMGHPSCSACPKCGKTLAESPDGHREPEPHDWLVEWKIDAKTGERWQERICGRCHKSERLP